MMERHLNDLRKSVASFVCLLVGCDELVQFADKPHSQRFVFPRRLREEVERVELSRDRGKGILVDAALPFRNFERQAFGNKSLGHSPVNVVKTLNDSGLNSVPPQAALPSFCEFLRRC